MYLSQFKPKPMLFTLIMTNFGVTILLAVLSACGIDFASHLALPASFSGFLNQPWGAVTYMFTQTNFLHLLFNMLWLFGFGNILLYVSDSRRLLISYIGGGLTGALLYILVTGLNHISGNVLIGSSAAVLSVMTAAWMAAPNLEVRVFLITGVRLKWVALLCILLAFFGVGASGPGGIAAHLGGVIFGMIKMPQFRMRKKVKPIRVYKAPANHRERINPEAAREAFGGRLNNEERLDQLLDKVRLSGYDSLTEAEKRELDAISHNL